MKRRRFVRRVLLVTLLVLLVPYGYSRVASLRSRVSIRQQATSTAGSSIEPDSALRIATFNIAHGRGTAADNWSGGDRADRRQRLIRIAKLLRDSQADIVVLNECDFDCLWSHHVNQAEFIANEAGFAYWVEQRNIDFRFNGGSLQRWPASLPDRADMTFPSSDPAQVIDWILVPTTWRIISYEVPATDLSDHLPVVATIDWHDTAVPREW